MVGSLIQKVEGAKRQRRSIAKKRKIVEQTMQPGASVARVAHQHGVNANQVFYWRNLYRQGRLGEKSTGSISLLPVTARISAAMVRRKLEQAVAKIRHHRGDSLCALALGGAGAAMAMTDALRSTTTPQNAPCAPWL